LIIQATKARPQMYFTAGFLCAFVCALDSAIHIFNNYFNGSGGKSDLLSACHEQSSKRTRVKLAGCVSPWASSRMSQAFDSQRFLVQAPFDKPALKL
jgi:hypothetical protein